MMQLNSKTKKLRLNNIVRLTGAKQTIVPTPKDYESEKVLVDLVVDEFRKRTPNEELITDIRFVSGEMINNARYHGNNLNPSKNIMIDVAWKGNDFYLVVKDEGEGFDMENPKIKDGPPESGLGIILSKRKADLVYNFRDSASYVCMRVPKNKLEAQK